ALTYNDVHFNITHEEWALMDPSQKKLYKDVMVETYMNLTAIGMKEVILQRNHMNILRVVKPLQVVFLKGMKKNILERNPMNIINVVKHLHNTVIFKGMKEHILERNPMNVNNVIKHVTGIPSNPQGQGIIERAHQTLKSMLHKLKRRSLYDPRRNPQIFYIIPFLSLISLPWIRMKGLQWIAFGIHKLKATKNWLCGKTP
ncbi:zinc finger protein 844-like, partial [Peromyscus eremicus]|uniref:zinc finger protein 844-like n=1 Tax=Peromyscus eremicus TaxID=42410 RepID=UPI0027DD36E5